MMTSGDDDNNRSGNSVVSSKNKKDGGGGWVENGRRWKVLWSRDGNEKFRRVGVSRKGRRKRRCHVVR